MKVVLCHFLEIVAMDGADMAYNDWAKYFSAFGDDKRSCIINELCIIAQIIQKRAENEVLGIFLDKYDRCMHETAPEYSSNDSL